MPDSSKVTLHMVQSLDGFVAKKDNDVSWLHSHDRYPQGVTLTEEEITEFVGAIGCYVMGSRTYEQALELGWPYGDVPVTVVTSRKLPAKQKSVSFYSGDLTALIREQLKPKYPNIWMVGGSMLTKEFLRLGLADEIVISIMPVILGGGTPFFDEVGRELKLHLKDEKAFTDGMVEMCYEILK